MDNKLIELAMARSSEWFRIHSDHRLRLFNFFIILFLAAVAGFGTATKEDLPYLQLLSGALLVIISLVFKLLDQRTSLLIKDAEVALQCVEELITKDLSFVSWSFRNKSAEQHRIA